MKKLLFIFVAFLTLTLLNGCDDQGKTTRFDENGQAISNDAEKDPETSTPSQDPEAQQNGIKADPAASAGKGLSVSSFTGNTLKTNLNYNVIRGKSSKETYSIQVNGYKLKKYFPGQTGWSYLAASRLGTLKNGVNTYEVKAFAKNGKELQSLTFSINYDAKAIPELPIVGISLWINLVLALFLSSGYYMIRKYKF